MERFELVATSINGNLTIETKNEGFNALELIGILDTKRDDIVRQVNCEADFKRTFVNDDGSKEDILNKEEK